MSEEQLIDQITQVWPENYKGDHSLSKFAVEVLRENDGTLSIEVSQMYEFLVVNFSVLEKLAELFGTKEFNVNNWSAGGCETCDYGSKYSHVFTGIPATILDPEPAGRRKEPSK